MHGQRRILRSLLVVGLVASGLAAGWAAVGDAPHGTAAGLFAAPVVDLRLHRDGAVDGFLASPNLAPGDLVAGELLVLADASARDLVRLDLDLDVRGRLEGRAAGVARLDEAFRVERLRYGSDDLLSSIDGGRDLLREIDRNPVVGNGDGRLSARELDAGANDLAPPAVGGSVLDVAFRLDPALEDPRVAGQRLGLTFVFRLGDALDADLN